MLIDAAAYYVALLQAFRQARSRIMVLGWDFDPRMRLDPADPATELRRLLPALLERRPDLHVHLLVDPAEPLSLDHLKRMLERALLPD